MWLLWSTMAFCMVYLKFPSAKFGVQYIFCCMKSLIFSGSCKVFQSILVKVKILNAEAHTYTLVLIIVIKSKQA